MNSGKVYHNGNPHNGNPYRKSCESTNNGGTTDYYQIHPSWKQAQDIIEARDMNFAQGNILKAAFCFNTNRHDGTTYTRELNKIIWFCQRELERIQKNCNTNGIPFNGFGLLCD